MLVRLGSSAVESGEETLVWSKYSAGTVTGTFLASETEPQGLYCGPIGPPSQIPSHRRVSPAWSSARLLQLCKLSKQVSSLQTICLHCFPSLSKSVKLVMAIVTVLTIMTMLAIETVMAIVTALVIETVMAIVTALVIETDLAIVTVVAGIKYKKLVPG